MNEVGHIVVVCAQHTQSVYAAGLACVCEKPPLFVRTQHDLLSCAEQGLRTLLWVIELAGSDLGDGVMLWDEFNQFWQKSTASQNEGGRNTIKTYLLAVTLGYLSVHQAQKLALAGASIVRGPVDAAGVQSALMKILV